MKAILFLSLCTFLLGDSALIDGLERASHRYKETHVKWQKLWQERTMMSKR